MSAIPTWNAEISVGNQTLDKQHQRILFLCRCIVAYFTKQPIDHGMCRLVLADILDLLAEHCKLEEEILALNHYPDLEQHANEHRQNRERLSELLEQALNSPVDTEPIESFLIEWTNHHLLHTDLACNGYLKDPRERRRRR